HPAEAARHPEAPEHDRRADRAQPGRAALTRTRGGIQPPPADEPAPRAAARAPPTDHHRTGGAMLKEFRTFIMRGNMLNLAVGVVIGAAFGKIVTSFVTDMLMPPIGLVLGRVDFTNLFVTLSGQPYPTIAAAKAAGAPTLNYGLFLNAVVDFLIVG